MSDDEIFATIMSCALGLITWLTTLVRLARFRTAESARHGKAVVALAYPVALILVFLVLRTMASFDVVNDPRYLFMYAAMGAAWIGVFGRMALWGVSLRDDLLERGNSSAGFAQAGFIIAVGLCFAGGNIGDGPGWWVVVFAASLSTVTLSALWWVLHSYTHVADDITVDRDESAGIRMAGFFIGTGLILGRSVAGDWESGHATVRDFFRHLWPALVLWVIALMMERRTGPKYGERTNALNRGLFPAVMYVILGIIGAAITGPIE
jgi:hypothetical protein